MKRWRHLIIAVLLVPAISVYVMLCLYLSGFVVGIHWSFDLAYFLAAGLAWLFRLAGSSAGLRQRKADSALNQFWLPSRGISVWPRKMMTVPVEN